MNAAGYAHEDKPVEVDLNFTQLLIQLGKTAKFDEKSIRVTEVNCEGKVIDGAIPFQFDIRLGL